VSARITRTREDLEASLREQVGFLQASATLFDNGHIAEAKRLATTLRVLLHDKRQSKSVLSQLGYGFLQFHDSTGPEMPENLLTDCPLVIMAIGGSGPDFIPLLDTGPFPTVQKPFAVWWSQVVFVDDRRAAFSRKDIVLSVAETDGGAHVDPGIPEAYHRLSRENSIAWMVGSPTGKRAAQNPVPAVIRQITFEVLRSLEPAMITIA
jgi:hypothetical protein